MGGAFSLPGLQDEGLASLQLDRLPGQVADAYFGAGQVGHGDHSPPCRCGCGADVAYHPLVAFEITVGKVETRHVHAVGDHASEGLTGLGGWPDGADDLGFFSW